jgi:hypothetical protein
MAAILKRFFGRNKARIKRQTGPREAMQPVTSLDGTLRHAVPHDECRFSWVKRKSLGHRQIVANDPTTTSQTPTINGGLPLWKACSSH